MSGRHAKQTALTLKLTGGFLAASLLGGTFGAAAHANTLNENEKSSAEVTASAMNLAGLGAVNKGGLSAIQVKLDGKTKAATGAKDADAQTRSDDQAERAADEEQAIAGVTAKEFVAKAKTQLGQAEDSSGKTKFGEWYSQTQRAAETVARDGGSRSAYLAAEWCNMFVSWVAEETGMKDSVGQDAWTIAHAKWFKEEGRWGTTPKPGAIVFFNWNGEKGLDDIVHVGIVDHVDDDGTIHTVEGNTGNKVQEKVRSASQIVGYGYPEYKG
ncbi:CHAP domain-containing protein [Actinocorallia sp. A-T 12471]|uniref:CHAP domain-containing protein n=1 Tax=Actinocorallia sp. A-T 12471 TaxID=3089813 RepID=UPI0029CCCED8|nr:CHAP domain-containing protein [Actinocorallia sp. A-T 12471]MDX6743193.1 CHAP domain-containing protein [Actinocorallia sp. A-T 12471]